ncbi:hypothetical protein [Phenylobacterium sp.]|uniref:hypothetical protein n=1 Tax=Phenylobacterium sp. TaxID=1871053 RepID=UPI0025FEFE22|nr:hypothetical protein [Phenylobacterium sp.]
MMRTAAVLAAVMLAAVALGACSNMGGVGAGHNGGIATYDDLKDATAKCAAKGGHLKLQRNGDAQHLEDYACEKDK